MSINRGLLQKSRNHAANASSWMKFKDASDSQFKSTGQYYAIRKYDKGKPPLIRNGKLVVGTLEDFTRTYGTALRLYTLMPYHKSWSKVS